MHELTAQVTSSLLPFPAVTLEVVGEDEITLDSLLHGKFTAGRGGHAWLACGPHLEVIHGQTRERLSAYCFNGGGEHPPSVLTAKDFSWLKRSGLLVGLEETEGSVLCLYDLGLSRVAKAVGIPGRITAIEPLVSYGGASTSTQHLHQSLRWFFGIAAVVTDLGHVLLVDLCLDDLSCSQSEQNPSSLQVVTKSPREIPRLREMSTREGRHLSLQLNAPNGVPATALQYIPRTNQLVVGFSDGYLQVWNLKSLRKEYNSQLDGGRVPVHAFTFQEPENDPRNCCYLWAVQSSQDQEGDTVSLHLLQMAFRERKCLPSGKIVYEGLEYCEERYSQELSGTAYPLRAQTTRTHLLRCQTIEKFRPHPDRDDSMNEVASPDTSISIFSWQVKTYGQAMPSTYIGVFDINRWYHAQMPDSFRMGESLRNCPYIAIWCLDPVTQMASPHSLLDVVVQDHSLSRGIPLPFPPPEQYFHPTAYNFDATCLFNSGIAHSTCSGYQKETLSFLKNTAPCSSDVISSIYSRCLMSGLLSSRLADAHTSSLSQEEQLDAILATAVETCSLKPITDCIKQWTAEEQPGSALNLRYILDWAWNKVIQTKEELDSICAPLFDSSANFTDPQTLQLMQHSQRLLNNLSIIFHCLLTEAQELTQKGLVGLVNKNVVSNLISKYVQVVLWFCRTGLLPEGSDIDAMQLSRPFYCYSVISNYYSMRREELTAMAKDKWCGDCLMIDNLVGQCGEPLTNLWKRDEGGTGRYPPRTIHALLDIYLLDSVDESTKHAIVIYLLLDVMYSFPNKEAASVESFPTAFDINFGLVKLVQGLWLLDNRDHQRSFELLLNPAASQCHFAWQHERVLQALMCQGQHSLALRYFHATRAPINSMSLAKLCLSVLLHNRCLTEAWLLLRQHSNHFNATEMLGFMYESCQELGLLKELLKLPLCPTEQDALEKFLLGTGGLQNKEILMVHYLQQANYIPALRLTHSLKMQHVNERDPKLKERSNIRNSIMDLCGKVLPRVQRKLAMEAARPYQHPRPIHKEVTRPQPLSTITKRCSNEVMSRAGFINNVLTKIEEVWLGKGDQSQSPAAKSPRPSGFLKPAAQAQPEPFLGTPIRIGSKRFSRLMDVVVQSPQSVLSPPRPSWAHLKSTTRAPEFSLLQTPPIVKRARAMTASSAAFSDFAPQSILRSTPRPNPLATPSASPGRSVTPPLRGKESRITFSESSEQEKDIHWTNGMVSESEINPLTKGIDISHTRKSWSAQLDEDEEAEPPRVKFMPPEGGIPSPQLRCSMRELSPIHKAEISSKPHDTTQAQLILSFDASQTSFRSTDTTLEYYDAPLSFDHQGDGETINSKEGNDVVVDLEDESRQNSIPASEPAPLEILSKDKDQELKENKKFENVMDIAVEQEVDIKEVECKIETEADIELPGDQDETEGLLDEDKTECEMEDNPDTEPGIKNEDVEVIDQAPTGHGDKLLDTAPETESQPESSFSDENTAQLEVFESAAILEQIKTDGDTQTITITHQVKACEHGEVTEFIQHMNAFGDTEVPAVIGEVQRCGDTEPADEMANNLEQTADLSAFVEQHLFGSGLSPALPRSGIRGSSNEEEYTSAEAYPVFTSQKSTTSASSSETTGTDSPSVVSLNDSEELSSSESEEEEEENENDEAEEAWNEQEEDHSGSEVEIIDEVQGNGRLLAPRPNLEFVHEDHGHFLSTFSEQQAAEFSLLPPGVEIKMVGEEMEGEVLMVRLGADTEAMEALEGEGQISSYVELKPSNTLLVPHELADGQQEVIDNAPLPVLQQPVMSDERRCETHGNFSLMLDMDEDADGEAVEVTSGNVAAEPEVILLAPDTPESEEATPEDDGQINLVINDYESEQKVEKPQEEGKTEECEPAILTDSKPLLVAKPTGALDKDGEDHFVPQDANEEETEQDEVIHEVTEAQKVSEDVEMEQTVSHVEVKGSLEEIQQHLEHTELENREERSSNTEMCVEVQDDFGMTTETERATRLRRTVRFTSPHSDKPEEAVTLHESAPSPSRRKSSRRAVTTRQKSTTMEQEDEATDKTDITVKRRSARKSTPRRSSRRTLKDSNVLQTTEEENKQEEFITPNVRKSIRKTRLKPSKGVEDETQLNSSPSRATRRSRRITFDVYPESTPKMEARISHDGHEPKQNSMSHRRTRNKLWDHPQEELVLLPTPLEVDSETPVAEALMKRLQDTEEKQKGVFGRILRSRRTMTSVDVQAVAQDKTNQGEDSLVTLPSRRRTRASIAESSYPTEELAMTVTRNKRGVQKTSKEVFTSEDVHVEEGKDVSKRRKTAKRTAKSSSGSEPRPLVEPVLISPPSSPDTRVLQSQKRTKEGEAQKPSGMTLRRRQIMNSVFAKPVTRRKNP
nr:protein ELYS-like [Nerophis lumbriciformis]